MIFENCYLSKLRVVGSLHKAMFRGYILANLMVVVLWFTCLVSFF